ncbi:unnamed protein product [Ectocarpus sp. 12 AP-2014]
MHNTESLRLQGAIWALLLQNVSAWWLWGETSIPDEVPPLNFSVLVGEEAGREWLQGAEARSGDSTAALEGVQLAEGRRSPNIPPRWNSSTCMESWGVPELQTEVDPGGYLLFSEGREQLGNNRFLLSDGLVIARALNRTLVEFPMQHSRISTPDADLGSCDYFDCERLCSYHRILDLWAFRALLRDRLLSTEDFLTVLSAEWEQTLLPRLVTAGNITSFFEEYDQWQVIAMKMAWKSALRREPVDLLRPNPFYLDLVGQLIEAQEGWKDGGFLSVQWRTETSTGNLTECYGLHVRSAVEERRLSLGFSRSQVFFNTDLVGETSTTYNATVVSANSGVVVAIRGDYPVAMDNTVYDILNDEQDAGVKAIISGLICASADFLLTSSFNGTGSNECQKPHSKYIDLVTDWRLDVVGKDLSSIGQMLPLTELEEGGGDGEPLALLVLLAGLVALAAVLVWDQRVIGRPRSKKVP